MKKIFLSLLLVISFLFLSGFTTLAQTQEYPDVVQKAKYWVLYKLADNVDTYEYRVDYFLTDVFLYDGLDVNEYFLITSHNIVLHKGLDRNTNSYELQEVSIGTKEGYEGTRISIRATLLKSFVNDTYPLPLLAGNFFAIDSALYVIYTPIDYEEAYNEGYNEGYDEGHYDGYNEGYEAGKNDGYNEGYDTGYDEGYSTGLNDGYNEGYNDGYEIGYNEGFTEGFNSGFEKGGNHRIYVAGISFGSVFDTVNYEGIEYKVFREDIYVSFPSATAHNGYYTELSNIQTRIDADKEVGFEYPFDILIIPLNLNPNAFLWSPALQSLTDDGIIYGLKYIMIDIKTERYAFVYDVGNGLQFLYKGSVYLDQATIQIPSDDISNYVGQYNFETGYSMGYENGVEDGYNEGYNKGYNEGYRVGVDYGLSVNDELAYKEGYKKGVNDGFMKDIAKWFGPMVLIVLIAGAYVTARNRRGDV